MPDNKNIYHNTVSPELISALKLLMHEKLFDPFRLVGGTALSLQLGHRLSVDIDLFTDAPYGSIDFDSIDKYLQSEFAFVDSGIVPNIGFGKSYFVGESADNSLKLDLYYTDNFIHDVVLMDEIRMATVQEIIAMKFDVIQRGGRKKDFWDIHELISTYSLSEMLAMHLQRYPYSHDEELITSQLVNFDFADVDFEPVCLKGKHWELIKKDLLGFVHDN